MFVFQSFGRRMILTVENTLTRTLGFWVLKGNRRHEVLKKETEVLKYLLRREKFQPSDREGGEMKITLNIICHMIRA